MDIFTPVVVALTQTGIKALIKQRAPDSDAWASATSAVLGAVLAQQAATDETLRRIERKIDDLARQRYQHRLDAGRAFLRDAQPSRRESRERSQLLEEARIRFTEAVAAAPDQTSRAVAEWHAGLTWMLTADLNDAVGAMTRARNAAFAGLLQARDSWLMPDGAEVRQQTRPWTLGRYTTNSWPRRAVSTVRDKQDPSVELAVTLAGTMQQTLEALGAPPSPCRAPRLRRQAGILGNEYDEMDVVVDLEPGLNDVLGYTLGLHAVKMFCRVGVLPPNPILSDRPLVDLWGVDADLTIGAPHDSLCDQVLISTARSYVVSQGGLDRENDYVRRALDGTTLPTLSGERLLPDASPRHNYCLSAGPDRRRGWLRMARVDWGSSTRTGSYPSSPPAALTFRVWPFGPPRHEHFRRAGFQSMDPGLLIEYRLEETA